MSHLLPPRQLADALWLLTARSRGGQHWVSNTHCQIDSVTIAGHNIPISLLEQSGWQESYVSSPRSTWLRYAQQEALRQLPQSGSWLTTAMKTALQLASCPVSALLKGARLDQAAIIGNHLISTNLYPAWNHQDMLEMTMQLTGTYSERPLMMRNICPAVNPELHQILCKLGWHMIPSRMVYLCDPQENGVWKHNHVKQDARLLRQPEVEIVYQDNIHPSDLPGLRKVFRQLFIDKHSHLNPDFSPAFFELCLETSFLELIGLRWQEQWVGVLGLYAHPDSGWITTPLIGYDTSLPQELGLYRRLMAILLQQARQRHLRLHYSSGAARFKRARGGVAALEYTAIYTQHLPAIPRSSHQAFKTLLQTCAPTLLTRADQ
ncbi:hypothetical protein ACO0LB_02710 [Undibacterium sp. SXout7W]|uniref:hypothetical protein n=1 Tax=Undibacterium sp. SXout7W TaxID=3413049 RepID=UPI003BF06CD1